MAITSPKIPSEDDFVRMEGEFFTRLERSHTRKVRRHRLVATTVVVLVAAGGTMAAGTVANSERQTNSAICYSHASTSSQSSTVLLASRPGSLEKISLRKSSALSALDVCSSLYTAGVLGKDVEKAKLQACIQDNLVLAVFPKSSSESATEFCDNLGMSAP